MVPSLQSFCYSVNRRHCTPTSAEIILVFSHCGSDVLCVRWKWRTLQGSRALEYPGWHGAAGNRMHACPLCGQHSHPHRRSSLYRLLPIDGSRLRRQGLFSYFCFEWNGRNWSARLEIAANGTCDCFTVACFQRSLCLLALPCGLCFVCLIVLYFGFKLFNSLVENCDLIPEGWIGIRPFVKPINMGIQCQTGCA